MSLPAKHKKSSRNVDHQAVLAQSGILDVQALPERTTYAIALINPTSKALPAVLYHLKDGVRYEDVTDDMGNQIYLGIFEATPKGLRSLLAVYWQVANWRGSLFFKNMRPLQNSFHGIMRWIQCFVDSESHTDLVAYCCVVDQTSVGKFLCPCRCLHGYTGIEKEHPSPPEHQYYACALRQGYTECPNFSMSHFQRINNR